MFLFIVGIMFSCLDIFHCEQNCGILVKSNCLDDNTTLWNKNNVGNNIKDWIQSIQPIHSPMDKDQIQFFIRKILIQYELRKKSFLGESKVVAIIANSRCNKTKHFGPIWKKASMFSGTQFHDGFLYGIQNAEGELIGKYEMSFIIKSNSSVYITCRLNELYNILKETRRSMFIQI